MPMSADKRKNVAHLSSRLFEQLWLDQEFTLPEGAHADLRDLLHTTRRILFTLVTPQRRGEIYEAVWPLTTAPGFDGAIKQAEDGARAASSDNEPVLFAVGMPEGKKAGVSFSSGKNLLATMLYQIAGVGRRRRSQAARQRNLKRAGGAKTAEPASATSMPGAPAAPSKAVSDAVTAELRSLDGPIAVLLRAIKSASR